MSFFRKKCLDLENIKKLFLTFSFLLLWNLSCVHAAPLEVPLESWEEVPGTTQWWLEKFHDSGDRVGNIIFNGLNDLKFFKTPLGKGSVEFSLHRRVFDNRTTQNSWTVVDRFIVRGSLPLYAQMFQKGGEKIQRMFGFSLGVGGRMEWVNIRQALPKQYKQLPNLQERKRQIQQSPWYRAWEKDREKKSSQGSWIFRINEWGKKVLSWMPWLRDPKTRARYGNLLNFALIPFKLPLKVSHLKKLDPGEIISYLGEGSLHLGGSVGWELDPSQLSGAMRGSLSFTVFLRGIFRISILKEDAQGRFVRVKITRGYGFGHSASASIGHETNLLDGIFLLRRLSGQMKIIPFEFSVDKNWLHAFDVVYRYDLSKKRAQEAYEQAVLGRLTLSDFLSVDLKGRTRNFYKTGVKKIVSQKRNSHGESQLRRMKIGFLFRSDQRKWKQDVEAVVLVPTKKGVVKRKIFRSMVENSKEWKLFWAWYEKFRYRFTVELQIDEYKKHPENPALWTLAAEGAIKDSATYGDELKQYILETENAVGRFGLFPRPPKVNHEAIFPISFFDTPFGPYGRSRFYYRLVFGEPQIQKFIHFPEEKMWATFEKVFHVASGTWQDPVSRFFYSLIRFPLTLLNIPLYVFQWNFSEATVLPNVMNLLSRWKNLKRAFTARKRAELLGDFFYHSWFSFKMIRLLRAVMDQEKVYYFATGYNQLFPGRRLVFEGKGKLSFRDIASEKQRELDFDQPWFSRKKLLTSWQILNLAVNVLKQKRTIAVSFFLNKVPKALYFELRENHGWAPWRSDRRSTLVWVQQDGDQTFHKGKNVIFLDPLDRKSPWYALVRILRAGDTRFLFRVAGNFNGVEWGKISNTEFYYPEQTFNHKREKIKDKKLKKLLPPLFGG